MARAKGEEKKRGHRSAGWESALSGLFSWWNCVTDRKSAPRVSSMSLMKGFSRRRRRRGRTHHVHGRERYARATVSREKSALRAGVACRAASLFLCFVFCFLYPFPFCLGAGTESAPAFIFRERMNTHRMKEEEKGDEEESDGRKRREAPRREPRARARRRSPQSSTRWTLSLCTPFRIPIIHYRLDT